MNTYVLFLFVYSLICTSKGVSEMRERNMDINDAIDGHCEKEDGNCESDRPTASATYSSSGGGYVYHNTRPGLNGQIPKWNSRGYVFFCPCMGRTGNQIDHLLGVMAFAQMINRTLILPPLRTYRNVRFTEWFKFEPLAESLEVVLAEDFMEFLAPKYWPKGKRIGFCWQPTQSKKTTCDMKKGPPFGPFWDGLDIDFDDDVVYHFDHSERMVWENDFSPEKYPVLAFRGAPASYPVLKENRHYQRYLVPSERIENEAQGYIDEHFKGERFVGIHLRIASDWVNSCKNAVDKPFFMSSPQCLEQSPGRKISQELCLPSKEEILRLTKKILIDTKSSVLFVATDKEPMIQELEEHLQDLKVKVFNLSPHLAIVDLTILTKADFFIGSCLSSFTAYVKRARDVQDKSSTFWGLE